MNFAHSTFYVLLSELTSGVSIASKTGSKSSALISCLTLGIGRAPSLRYEKSPLTAKPKPSDEGIGSADYLPPSHRPGSAGVPLVSTVSDPLEPSRIPLGTLASQSFNLVKRFSDPSEASYRDLVYTSLTDIIQSNVDCLTYNPIFGRFWRAICEDPSSRKTDLVNLFSEFVGKVTEPEKKAALCQWLEECFDQTEDIEGIIARHWTNGAYTNGDLRGVAQLLRRWKIATVFTHLKLMEREISLAPSQLSIPLTPALTATISLVTAVPFLKEPATALLATTQGKWLDMDVPENSSFDCARFLLSAPKGVVLTKRERQSYEAMRRYRLKIELNMDAPLIVEVPWTPDKTQSAAKSIIADETTAQVLVAQDSVEWLGFSNKDIFDGKSAVKLMQAFGGRVFADVSPTKSHNLVLNGKRVRETGQIIVQIQSRVGRGEVVPSARALCFEECRTRNSFRPVDAPDVPNLSTKAYGKNEPGKLLNMMQFTCPFCRGKPTVKLLVRYNRRAVALGGCKQRWTTGASSIYGARIAVSPSELMSARHARK
ncbi:hypothetical protein DFH09DRAFT_1355223 [Mycena vulgaris]|nr:hypothetical protein DFH09DRAFT_1355223 [Mycena vulgaris]